MEPIDTAALKRESERVILAAGGRVCDWLPVLDVRNGRSRDELLGRALVMNALLNIHFQAPIPIVRAWIEREGLTGHLSGKEAALLRRANRDLSKQELTDLYWYIEALWTLMWAGKIVEDLRFDHPVPSHMVELVPNLQRNEDGAKFSRGMGIRPHSELLATLDLYYRLHWWTRDGSLNGYATEPASLDIIMERRKALEWVADRDTDWDDIDLST